MHPVLYSKHTLKLLHPHINNFHLSSYKRPIASIDYLSMKERKNKGVGILGRFRGTNCTFWFELMEKMTRNRCLTHRNTVGKMMHRMIERIC